MKFSINKTLGSNVFLFDSNRISRRKNVKYFYFLKVSHNQVCLYGSKVNCRRNCFRKTLRIICHTDFKYDSISFLKQRKQPVKYQDLDISLLILNEIVYSAVKRSVILNS